MGVIFCCRDFACKGHRKVREVRRAWGHGRWGMHHKTACLFLCFQGCSLRKCGCSDHRDGLGGMGSKTRDGFGCLATGVDQKILRQGTSLEACVAKLGARRLSLFFHYVASQAQDTTVPNSMGFRAGDNAHASTSCVLCDLWEAGRRLFSTLRSDSWPTLIRLRGHMPYVVAPQSIQLATIVTQSGQSLTSACLASGLVVRDAVAWSVQNVSSMR